MKLKFNILILTPVILLSITLSSRSALAQFTINSDSKATVFAPGIVSTADGEFAPTFSPDGKTVYFTGGPTYIYFSKFESGQWTKPVIASFSGQWKDMDPFMSPDGKKLFFSSYRPYDGTTTTQLKFAHIWYVERINGEDWSKPNHIEAPINLPGINNYAPAVSRTGALYFYSPNRDLNNKSSYSSNWLNNHFTEPVIVPVEGNGGVHDPYISPDERFLVFASGGQLYITFKNKGNWSERHLLDKQVNDNSKNSSPCISPDGKFLYYSSSRENGILMIPVKIKL
jgi:Tol biopolymer transport system component